LCKLHKYMYWSYNLQPQKQTTTILVIYILEMYKLKTTLKSQEDVVSTATFCHIFSLAEYLKGQLQRKFFISVNKLWLYKITIYVTKN